MKTVIITAGNLSSLIALADFLNEHQKEISAVFITSKIPSESNNFLGIFKILKSSGFIYTFFKLWMNLVLPKILNLVRLPSTIPQYLHNVYPDIPIVISANINDTETLNMISKYEPEVILSFSATKKFSSELIQIPKHTSVNVHYSLLPGYAGLSPYFWYLKNREQNAGVTLHVIDSDLDSGPIIAREVFPIENETSVASVLLKQAMHVSPILNSFYGTGLNVENVVDQDSFERSYYRHPSRQEIKEFRKDNLNFFEFKEFIEIYKLLKKLRTYEI